MPKRSQRRIIESRDYIPGTLSGFNAIGGLGKADLAFAAGYECNRINVYRVPNGVPLDKAVHSKLVFPTYPGQNFAYVDGDPNISNLAGGVAPLLDRQWSAAAGVYTHANTNLDNRAMYSSDGINWLSATTMPTDANPWEEIVYSPSLSRLVAVSRTGVERCMSSDDGGVTWTVRPIGVTANWSGLCWSPELNLFVVGSSLAAASIYTSPDGVTWTSRSNKPVTVAVRSICWSKELSLFVAVGDAAGTNTHVMTSSNGIDWVAQTSSDLAWWSVCWSAERNRFVAVANSGTGARVMTSPNGTTWTAGTANAGFDVGAWNSVIWVKELNLFVTACGSGATPRIYTSPDGFVWSGIALPTVAQGHDGLAWSPTLGRLVVACYTGTNRAGYSSDGINWNYRQNGPWNNTWHPICWAGPPFNRFVSLSQSSAPNPELISWTGLSLKAADKLRVSFNLLTDLAIGTIASNPGRATSSPMSPAGQKMLVVNVDADADAFGFYANTDKAAGIRDIVFYKETALCAPQGVWDYYAFPANFWDQEGPGITVAGVTII